LGNTSFIIQQFGEQPREPEGDDEPCFILYKDREGLDAYAESWRSLAGFAPQRIFEVGIFKGGSAVLFAELFHPEKLVAIDLKRKEDIGAINVRQLDRWLAAGGEGERVKLYWEVDQADTERLRSILREEFRGPLDFVVDDGSHLYYPSKRTFETLFPRLRPGGWYVIEDWPWSFVPLFQTAGHPWALEVPLAKLVAELLAVTGSPSRVISAMRVDGHYAFFQRGDAPLADDFKISEHISRPQYGRAGVYGRRLWWTLARSFGKAASSRS